MRKCPYCTKEYVQWYSDKNKTCEDCKLAYEKDTQILKLNIPLNFDVNIKFPAGHPSEKISFEEKGNILFFTGPLGVGKTMLASRMLYEMPYTLGTYVRFIDLVMEVRSTWKKTSRIDEDAIIKKYRKFKFLVIDEIGVQMGSDNERNILYSILIERYERDYKTILTTNLDPRKDKVELLNCVGARIIDRIMDGWVDCSEWPRLRMSSGVNKRLLLRKEEKENEIQVSL